tara:strand:+ start:144 stop:692 length:549 start_codon:yes stop_codon:yes gene_type:complete
MATVYEIVQGLTQAAANAYDGALTKEGEPLTAGLQREEGNPLIDKRVMDGFNVRFFGNKMILSYQSEVQLKEVYANGFEGEIDQRLTDIVSFLKKEARKVTGSSVKLKQEGDVDVKVESVSRHRSWVVACRTYIIENVDAETVPQGSKERLDSGWKSFLEQGGWKGKRPKNDSRKKGSEKEK